MRQTFLTEYVSFNGISARRAREQELELSKFEAFLPVPLVDVDEQHFRDYLVKLAADGLHPNTVRWRANMIRPFFKWAARRGHIDQDRLARLMEVENPYGCSAGQPRPYTRKELRQFWDELAETYPKNERFMNRFLDGKSRWNRAWRHATRLQFEAITALALSGGLRRREIFEAALDDIHYDNEFIVVRHAKGHQSMRRKREVPYTRTALERMEAWIELRTRLMQVQPPSAPHERPWLSLSPWSPSLPTDPLPWERFEKMFGKLGSGWELHRFRHTFGTEWLRTDKVTLEQVSRAMGHASLQQTMRYAQILRDDVQRSMDAGGEAFENAIAGDSS